MNIRTCCECSKIVAKHRKDYTKSKRGRFRKKGDVLRSLVNVSNNIDKNFLKGVEKRAALLLKRLEKKDELLANPPQEFQRAYEASVNKDIEKRPWAYDYEAFGILAPE